MNICVLTANLGGFDTPVDPVEQELPEDTHLRFHRFTYENFPPIADLPPRFQYRIPKMFGWQLVPGFDVYIWLDGSFSFTRADCVEWFLEQLGDADIALFKHPWRNSMFEEVKHVEDYLEKGDKYITPRYKGGLHKEQLADIYSDETYRDDKLFTSTAFIYRNTEPVHDMLRMWWLHTSRYFTVDQIALPYVARNLRVQIIEENQYKIPYLTLVSKHG